MTLRLYTSVRRNAAETLNFDRSNVPFCYICTLWFIRETRQERKWRGWKMVLKLDYFYIFQCSKQDIHPLYIETQSYGSITNIKTIFQPCHFFPFVSLFWNQRVGKIRYVTRKDNQSKDFLSMKRRWWKPAERDSGGPLVPSLVRHVGHRQTKKRRANRWNSHQRQVPKG